MERRSFLAGILASCAAPAFVRSGVLMPVKSLILPSAAIITPRNFTAEWSAILEANLRLSSPFSRIYAEANQARIAIRRPDLFVIDKGYANVAI